MREASSSQQPAEASISKLSNDHTAKQTATSTITAAVATTALYTEELRRM